MLNNENIQKPCVLIITTMCGGGHLQAANALRNRIESENPDISVLQIDIFNDWLGRLVGGFLTQRWNAPLRRGHNFISLAYSYIGIPVADPLFFLPLFISALKTFLNHNIIQIIDTQPVGTAAISLALKISNRLKKQSLKIEKILTEIPTKRAIHFFHPLKLLPKKLKELIELHIVEPIPEESNFWNKYCGLNNNQIKIIKAPLREAFFKIQEIENQFSFSFVSVEEKNQILKIAKIDSLISNENPLSVNLQLGTQWDATTIMLGSQPQTRTIQKYLDKLSNIARGNPSREYIIFVLGNSNINGWSQIKKIWEEKLETPSNFHPVLLSMQQHETVAQLLKFSDRTITRSGGLTSMELLKVRQSHALIHSDILKEGKPVLKKMPPWEIGNAEILMQRIGAKIIHPDCLESLE